MIFDDFHPSSGGQCKWSVNPSKADHSLAIFMPKMWLESCTFRFPLPARHPTKHWLPRPLLEEELAALQGRWRWISNDLLMAPLITTQGDCSFFGDYCHVYSIDVMSRALSQKQVLVTAFHGFGQ